MFSQNTARGRMNLNVQFSDNADILHTLRTILQAYERLQRVLVQLFFLNFLQTLSISKVNSFPCDINTSSVHWINS